jgi:hypothetical protein
LITPTGAPRVLDFPVVLVAIGVLQATAITSVASVPPFIDVTCLVNRSRRVRLGRWLGRLGVITSIGVANNDNSVIQSSSAAVISSDDS